MRYILPTLIVCAFILAWNKSFGDTVTTGNVLTNSTFGTGETVDTTGWSTDGTTIHTHGEWGFPYQTGMDDSGGVLAFEGNTEDNVYQDVDLVGDSHLTQWQINQGFTSTMAADVWFWNNVENTLTLKQTITSSDGSVSTQVREITGTSSTTDNKFINYTNVYTHGYNTQTDFTIRAELFNETAGTSYDSSHYGPDVDNVTLNVSYSNIPPINEDAQEAIDDIDENIIDIIDDIPEEFYWEVDNTYLIEDMYLFNEPEVTVDETYSIIESDYFEDDMYFEEPMEEITENEESIPETFTDEEETVETIVAKNETETESPQEKTEEQKEEEPDSEGTEESEVQAEDSEEQDEVQSEDREVDTDDRVIANASDVENKVKQNIKNITKQITQVTKETAKNLSKEDLFFKLKNLDEYKNLAFYSPKDIYEKSYLGLYLEMDLSSYTADIYAGVALNSYTENDPIEVHRVKLLEVKSKKTKLLRELEILKQ
jgi:hypothetical protein